MSLFLIESSLLNIANSKQDVDQKASELQSLFEEKEAALIELQVSKDFSRAFYIVEAANKEVATNILQEAGISIELVKDVRLVGDELDKVKQQKDIVNYLVEWNIPEDITMDQYLARKKKNSVHYEEVPEVSFARTYVCEDMSKCLCFYDAPDEAAVIRARDAVSTPIDSITELG